MSERELLRRTAEIAADYIETLDTRPIRPDRRYGEMLAWMSPITWDGRQTIRVSVVGWRTSESDVARTVAAFARAAG